MVPVPTVTMMITPRQREAPRDPMGKKNGKQRAAANREASKQNKPLPFQKLPKKDASLITDPNYILGPEEPSDCEPEVESQDSVTNDEPRQGKLHLLAERIAIFSLESDRFSRTAKSLFESVPNLRKVALAPCLEPEEPDSDIEIIENPTGQLETELEHAHQSEATTVSPPLCGSEFTDSIDDNDVEMREAVPFPSSTSSEAPETQSASTEAAIILPSQTSPVATSIRLPNDNEFEIKANHARLDKIITRNRTELTKKLTILTSATAAASVLDLEALAQFNKKSLELSLKRLRLVKSLPNATRLMRPHIKRKIEGCNPKMQASTLVASRCGKGDYYARSLWTMALHLLEHGSLPEKKQGKGAHHESLLLDPRICEALKEWVKGTLTVEEGGFVGRVKDTIKIFDVKYPDGVAVFVFDCSSAHEAFSSDALLAHKMNRSPGGKQPKMRDTIIPSTGQPQQMNFPDNYTETGSDGLSLAGQPKGMEKILRGRGLLQGLEAKLGPGKKVDGVCAKCKLSQAAHEKAMQAAKSKEDEADGASTGDFGARGLSEMEDEDLDRETDCCMQRFRELTDRTFPCAKKLIPESLDLISTENVRRYFRHCWRYMDAYSLGLNLRQSAYAVKLYSSHRRIPASITKDPNILARASEPEPAAGPSQKGN
ncbi:hypothetical protein C8J57DRAFT_1250450 [Mycena rebaudengoi]|nr:hypothetical protein C8J57DRAFT_1250450 [Mycena rebaudengoi]